MSQSRQAPTVLYSNIKNSNLSFTKLDKDNPRANNQWMAYPRYKHPNGETNFVFQTPPISLDTYGIPREDKKDANGNLLTNYHPTDASRGYFKIPLDPNVKETADLEKILSGLDGHIEKKLGKIVLEKYFKLFAYQPVVREPQERDDLDLIDDESEDKPKKKYDNPRYNYFKAKLSMEYQTNKIETVVYVKDPVTNKVEKRAFESVAELASVAGWKSKVRFIITVNKLWAMKNKNSDGNRKYGVGLKILQMEVTPSTEGNSGSLASQFQQHSFLDGGEIALEAEEEIEKADDAEKADEEEEVEAEAEEEEAEDEEDDEDDEDEDEDEEAEEEDEDEDDEDEDEDEVVEVKPKKGRKSKDVKSSKTKSKRR